MKLFVPHLEKFGGEFVPYAQQVPLVSLGINLPGNAEICMSVNVQAAFVAGRVLVQGHWQADLPGECSRCLGETVYCVEEHFSEEFRLSKGPVQEYWDRDAGGAEDILFYSGDVLDLKEYLRQSFLLSQPLKILCREDCKGLCPICGADRNKDECGCNQEIGDPRLRSLMALKRKEMRQR